MLIELHRTRGGRRRSVLTGSGIRALAVLVVGVGVPAGLAGPAAAETTVTVDAGYGGLFVPGRPVPVRLTVTADRLLTGAVEVGIDGSAPLSIPVEVPGGSEKRYLTVVPTNPYQAVATVTARLASGAGEPLTGQTAVRAARGEELVGLLPGAAGGRPAPAPAPLAVDGGTARFVVLGEAELNRAPASLEPLSTIAASADDLARLSPAARDGVVRWVDGGGRLLVGAAPGDVVPGLPEAWPAAAARVPAGRGEVRLVGGAIAQGAWAGLVEPTARGAERVDTGRPGAAGLAFSLASEAGVEVAQLSWLVAFLVAYVVIVGPVLYLVLRRQGRPDRAWVAIPLVALVFTAGAYAGGQGLRSATQVVHASVLDTAATGSTATSYLGVTSRRGETVNVALPPAWLPVPETGGLRTGGRVSRYTATPDALVASVPLDAGQFGVLGGAGPVPSVEGSLEVVPGPGPAGQVSGVVRNTTPWALDAVGVFSGASGLALGRLGPGESAPFTFAPVPAPPMAPPVEWQLWGTLTRGPRDRAVVDLELWNAAVQSDPSLAQPGRLVAAGWTREYDPPVRGGDPSGRTLVLGRSLAGAGPNVAAAEIVRGGVNGLGGQVGSTTARLVLAAGTRPDPAALRLLVPLTSFEVWTANGWSAVTCTEATCPVRPATRAAPRSGSDGSAVFVLPVPNAPPATPAKPLEPPISVPPNVSGPVANAAPIPPCPPGRECGTGFGLHSFSAPVPAGAIHDGVLFVRVAGAVPAWGFGVEGA